MSSSPAAGGMQCATSPNPKHFIFRVGQFNTSCLASEDDVIVKQGKQIKLSKQGMYTCND